MMPASEAVALWAEMGSETSSKPNAGSPDWVVLDELAAALPAEAAPDDPARAVAEPLPGMGCQDVPGLPTTGSAVTFPPLISQIATVPSVFRHRMSSEKPAPVKSPVPTAFHDVPGLPITGIAIGVAPSSPRSPPCRRCSATGCRNNHRG